MDVCCLVGFGLYLVDWLVLKLFQQLGRVEGRKDGGDWRSLGDAVFHVAHCTPFTIYADCCLAFE